MKDLRAICNEKEYAEVLAETSLYIDDQPKRDTKDGDRFESLLGLVEAYEAKHYLVGSKRSVE